MDKKKILENFETLSKAKKESALTNKLVLSFALCAILGSLIYSYMVTNQALNKVVVVESRGEFLKIKAEDRENIFLTLAKTTCSHLVHYANSFDRQTLQENQARALFYCDKNALQDVFNLYQSQNSYSEVLTQGVVYRCDIEEFTEIGNVEPYKVSFTSKMEIINGKDILNFRIYSEGTLIKTTPRFPNNVTGFFFNTYKQVIKPID